MSVSAPAAPADRVDRRTLPVAAVAIMVVAALIAGALLGGARGGDKAPPPPSPPATTPQSVAQQGISIRLPTGWTRGGRVSVPGFHHPLALQNPSAGLRAAVERLPATSSTLLPAALVQTLGAGPGRPAVVPLASGGHAWRDHFEADGSTTTLYAIPTTTGVATVACSSVALDTGAPRHCDALAEAITLPGSRVVPPGENAAFFSRIRATVADLDAARASAARQLQAAADAGGQARAADVLARAHETARAVLGPLAAEGNGAVAGTVDRLHATAAAYTALASAARARSPRRYAVAGRAVARADAGLRSAVGRALG
jgi:hypothetical protein